MSLKNKEALGSDYELEKALGSDYELIMKKSASVWQQKQFASVWQ